MKITMTITEFRELTTKAAEVLELDVKKLTLEDVPLLHVMLHEAWRVPEFYTEINELLERAGLGEHRYVDLDYMETE